MNSDEICHRVDGTFEAQINAQPKDLVRKTLRTLCFALFQQRRKSCSKII